jgi:hypothetical protein
LRLAILEFHKMAAHHFVDWEETKKVADDLIAFQRNLLPNIVVEHPDLIMPNEKASMFWYIMNEGQSVTRLKVHQKTFSMETKLEAKDIKMIADQGTKDGDLGILVPEKADVSLVKKEVDAFTDLEKTFNEVKFTYPLLRVSLELRIFKNCIKKTSEAGPQ